MAGLDEQSAGHARALALLDGGTGLFQMCTDRLIIDAPQLVAEVDGVTVVKYPYLLYAGIVDITDIPSLQVRDDLEKGR